jgi:hypothetical protein
MMMLCKTSYKAVLEKVNKCDKKIKSIAKKRALEGKKDKKKRKNVIWDRRERDCQKVLKKSAK